MSSKFKMWNPFLKKEMTFKHPYTKTALKIFKYMIKKEGVAASILPAGVTYNNGRIYIDGKGTRKQKIATLLQRHKYQRIQKNIIATARTITKERRNRWQALAKQLKAPNTSFDIQHSVALSKFNMVHVILTLKDGPTADHEEVLKQLRAYVDEKIGALNGRTLYMNFDFAGISLRYFTGEISDFSAAKFDRLQQSIDQWSDDQQNYSEKERYKMKAIELFVSTPRGGCMHGFPYLYDFEAKKLETKIYCPSVKGNNCLLDCLEQFKFNSRRTKSGAVFRVNQIARDDPSWVGVDERSAYYDGIREELGIALGSSIEVGGKAWNALLRHWSLRADVYVIRKGRFVRILTADPPDTIGDKISLWLHGGHFNVILNLSLVSYVHCQKCGHWVINVAEHTCSQHRCKKCNQYVSNDRDHDCAKLQATNKTNSGIIVPTKAHTAFTARDNIIFADFECFLSRNWTHQVYAAGYAIGDGDVVVLEGKDALSNFVDAMLALEEKHTLVFQNGANYDLLPVVNCLDAKNVKHTECYVNGGYLQLKFGKVTTLDIYRFTNASLQNACEGFDCEITKGYFNHERVKSWEDVVATRGDWRPYLIDDVRSMRGLYTKFAHDLWREYSLNMNSFMTISQLAYHAWRMTLEQPVHKMSFEMDRWVRRGVFGGRCYPCKQFYESPDADKTYCEIQDYLVYLDVQSEYPSSMLSRHPDFPEWDFRYPDGKFYPKYWITGETKEERANLERYRGLFNTAQCKKLCILEVELELPTHLISAPLPHKDECGFTRWSFEPSARAPQVYTSVDILRGIKYGYRIKKLFKILIFARKKRLFDEYIVKGFQRKCNARKNTAAYSIAKLSINAIFGKMLQRPYTKKKETCKNVNDFEKVRLKGNLTRMYRLTNRSLQVEYEPFDHANKDKFVTHPSYLGAFILSYSRVIMDYYIDLIDGYANPKTTYYRGDTDSFLAHSSQLDTFRKYLKPATLGMLDFDIKGKIIRFCEVAPKLYICVYVTAENERKLHVRAKGYGKEEQADLTWDHYMHMVGKNDLAATPPHILETLYENHTTLLPAPTASGRTKCLSNGQIQSEVKSIKRCGLGKLSSNQLKNGIENNSITSVVVKRTLNKTPWRKRRHIEGDPEMLSVAWGSNYKL